MDSSILLVFIVLVFVLIIAWKLKVRMARADRPSVDSYLPATASYRTSDDARIRTLTGQPFAEIQADDTSRPTTRASLYRKLEDGEALCRRHADLMMRIAEAYDTDAPTEALLREAEHVLPDIKREDERLSALYVAAEIADPGEAERFEEAIFEITDQFDDFIYNVEWLKDLLARQRGENPDTNL
ncbi:MAG: hypothetical protein AAGL24_27620 [Pseudomonadota bacterium]